MAWELWTRLLADETYEHGAPLETRVDELLAVAPSWRADGVDVRPERVLMQTLVAQRVGGERWRAWTKVLNREVLRARDLQVTGGTARERARLVCDERTRGGGLAAWSYDALAFEVYFKYWRLVGVR
ncbi:MAG: hypothetical protein H6828_06720 [Planctomycetes bacterium]|nr:hypothetical protein [Planctomycetota bacterium]